MERLTYRLNDQCDNPTDSIILKPYLRYEDPETRKKILNRLSSYEDSGLEPEEIADFMKRWEQTVEIGGMLKKYCIDHIRDLLHAEQDGRLVVLPCKAGDTLFDTYFGDIREKEVVSVGFMLSKSVKHMTIHANNFRGAITEIEIDRIGKEIFYTREEAEAALAQKGGEG